VSIFYFIDLFCEATKSKFILLTKIDEDIRVEEIKGEKKCTIKKGVW